MKNALLLLAIFGAVIPMLYFTGAIHGEVLPLRGILPALFANSVVGGITSDLIVSSAAFWVFILGRRAGPSPWPFIAINLLIGLSMALPLYFYFAQEPRAPEPGTTTAS